MIWCHDFCCYIGFGKDHVHLPSFWKILSFSLFDFCQHQVLNPQEVLKPITSLRDFRLFPQVHWSLGGWIFHALTSKDYLWGKEGGNECVFQILLPKQSTLHFPQYAWSGFSFWWLRTLTGYIPIQNKKFKVKKKKGTLTNTSNKFGRLRATFPGGSAAKNLLTNAGDTRRHGFSPWVE